MSQRNKRFNCIIFLLVAGFVGCITTLFLVVVFPFLLLFYAHITDQSMELQIDEVILTTGIDEAGLPIDEISKFSRLDERIYSIITLQSPFKLPLDSTLWVKWYYEEEQIAAHYLYPDPRKQIVIWIESPEGKEFRPGQYKIEIFLNRPLVRTVEFEVE